MFVQGLHWPTGCWMGFVVAYIGFFAGIGSKKPGWDWSVFFVPLFIFGVAFLFNSVGVVAGLFDRDIGKAEEIDLIFAYLRSQGALCLIFLPIVIVALVTMGR
jgi:hypothetical protein